MPKARHSAESKLRKWVRDTSARANQKVSESAVALMEKMLALDPAKRVTAIEAFTVRGAGWGGGGGGQGGGAWGGRGCARLLAHGAGPMRAPKAFPPHTARQPAAGARG